MYEIIGETVKSAISIKLGQIFGTDTVRYKEAITKLKYPHFFINQVTLTHEPAGLGNRIKLDYLINIRYRYSEDIATVTNLQQKLDDIGLKLCTEFTDIQLERPVKTYNRNYEKDEGVLQFFCNITVYAKPETEDKSKFKGMKLNEEVI